MRFSHHRGGRSLLCARGGAWLQHELGLDAAGHQSGRPAKAKRIVVLAEKFDGAGAVNWGLADEAVPDGTTVEAALEMARRAASLPPNGVRLC